MEDESDPEWSHFINLRFPNGKQFYWYRITFTSPDPAIPLSLENVQKQFDRIVKHDKAAPIKLETAPTDEQPTRPMEQPKDYFIRTDSDIYITQSEDEGSFIKEFISRVKVNDQNEVNTFSVLVVSSLS